MLTSFGFVVDIAYDGSAALAKLMASPLPPRRGSYAAVLLDVYMPGINGLEVTSRFRTSNRADATTLPIVGMSSDTEPILVERAHAAGMNVLLLKPIVRKFLEDLLYSVFSGMSGKIAGYQPTCEDSLLTLEQKSRSLFTLAQTPLGARQLGQRIFDAIPYPCFLKPKFQG